jgi:antitoxin ParD1/3/4
MTESASFNVEQYIREKVDSGEFSSPEEFTHEAVRVYHCLEAQRAELRAELQDRIAEADRGDVGPLDIDRIKAEGRRRLSALEESD